MGPWRSDAHTALLAPVADAPTPSVGFIRRCLGQLEDDGFTTVITAALTAQEQGPFLTAGFAEHEQLHLLGHDLLGLPERSAGHALRRARRADRDIALEIDAVAFDAFWRLDRSGLQDAIAATQSARFRVADGRDAQVCAYAVSGKSGRHGYLQRLAVEPAHQRCGFGRALALDGLHWMRRHGAHRAVVNTQLENRAALELYLSLGFRLEPIGLAVLRHELKR